MKIAHFSQNKCNFGINQDILLGFLNKFLAFFTQMNHKIDNFAEIL